MRVVEAVQIEKVEKLMVGEGGEWKSQSATRQIYMKARVT
jgi:hypothetical protein